MLLVHLHSAPATTPPPAAPAATAAVAGGPAVRPEAEAANLGTGRPLVAELGVGAVSREVAAVTALVAALVWIETTARGNAAASPCSGSGEGHADSSAANLYTIRCPAGFVGVVTVPVNHKSEAGDRASHPNFKKWPKLAENFFKIPLSGIGIQIGHVKATAVQVRGH